MMIKTIGLISGVIITMMTAGTIEQSDAHVPHYVERVIVNAGTDLNKSVPTTQSVSDSQNNISQNLSENDNSEETIASL